jgi:hypothetical protein
MRISQLMYIKKNNHNHVYIHINKNSKVNLKNIPNCVTSIEITSFMKDVDINYLPNSILYLKANNVNKINNLPNSIIHCDLHFRKKRTKVILPKNVIILSVDNLQMCLNPKKIYLFPKNILRLIIKKMLPTKINMKKLNNLPNYLITIESDIYNEKPKKRICQYSSKNVDKNYCWTCNNVNEKIKLYNKNMLNFDIANRQKIFIFQTQIQNNKNYNKHLFSLPNNVNNLFFKNTIFFKKMFYDNDLFYKIENILYNNNYN